MPKFVMIIVAVIVVSISMCYTANRICNTIDSKFESVNSNIEAKVEGLSKEIGVLRKDHEAFTDAFNKVIGICNTIYGKVFDMSIQHDAVMDILNETRITSRDTNEKVRDTNEKITFLYNMVKNQNPDLKPTTERNK